MPGEHVVSFAAGVVFGLALAAPPGPMNAIIAEESVVRGWTAGTVTGFGAMVADVVFFGLALAGVVTILERVPTLRAALVTVGGVVMLVFAYDALQSVRDALAPEPDGSGTSRGFQKALVLGLTNPYQILFWLTVGVGLLESGRVDVLAVLPGIGDQLAGTVVVTTGSAALVVGLFAGILVWIVTFPAALVAGRDRVDTMAPIVAAASAAVLAGFGVFFLWDGLSAL